MSSKLRILPLLAAGIVLLSSCMPMSRQLDEVSVIKALVFDTSEEADFEMLACIAVSDSDGKEKFENVQVAADSLAEALALLPSGNTPFLGQCDLIVFSGKLAERGFSDIVNALYSREEAMGAKEIAICGGDAMALFEGRAPYNVLDMLKSISERGFFSLCSVGGAKRAFASAGGSVLVPFVEADKEKVQPVSMAVAAEGKLLHIMTDFERRGAKWLAEGHSAEGAAFTVGGDGVMVERSRVVCRMQAQKTLVWDIEIKVTGDSGNTEEDAVKKQIEEDCFSAVLLAEKMKADFIGLIALSEGEITRENMAEADVRINVRITD